MWILLAQENATFLRENGLFTSAGQWAETIDGSRSVATHLHCPAKSLNHYNIYQNRRKRA
jgi:hypothetical protein